jgi:dihydrofolate synthase/folylpolyglutamate synthase
MTYEETVRYLFERLPMFQRIGPAAYKADLDNTIELVKLSGNPHTQFPAIHIAGTNGKGSVSHILAAVLQAAGYKTGLYISPHYKDFRERIKINGRYITEQAVVDYVQRHQSDIERIEPSFFEITVGMAFEYFAAEKVDIAVIETGLGGRLDSTNIITPLLSVITNIGYDHMDMLGNTLPLIAAEKGGIIKHGVPVVIGETHPETETVFRKIAEERHSPIIFADQHYQVDITSSTIGSMTVDVSKNGQALAENLQTDLYGNYQRKNLATCFAAIEQLKALGWPLSIDVVQKALQKVGSSTAFIGRCQVLGRNPLIIADSGHNEDGIKEIVSQINSLPFNHLHFVLGSVKDKDLSKTLPLLPEHATYYFCKPDIPRGLEADALKEAAANYGLKGNSYPTVKAAFDAAKATAQPDDLVFVGGSIFVVGEVL